jgi:hypothetical protein
MSKEKGREQVFQLGVKYINDIIGGEFKKKFTSLVWDDVTRQNIVLFFKEKYKELKVSMPFLKIEEYPKISMVIEAGKLKIHLQGWMNNCEGCWLLGGMWFNKNQFFDFYLCTKNFDEKSVSNKEYLIVRYGDNPSQRYLKKATDEFNYSVKWRAIYSLYRNRGNILSLNPFEIMRLGKE